MVSRYDAIIVGGRVAESATAELTDAAGGASAGARARGVPSPDGVLPDHPQQRRDAETAAMYACTDMLARFDPLTSETLDFFRAIAADRALADEYAAIYNSLTDPAAFFARFQAATA